MPPQEQNPYEFILDPQKQRSGPAFLQDPKKRIYALVAFVAVIFIFLFMVLGLLFGGGPGTQDLEDIAGTQNEIIRITESSLDTATNTDVRIEVSTINTVMRSDYQSTIAYMDSVGVKVDDKLLARYTNLETDERLKSAQERSAYEEELNEVLDELIGQYVAALEVSFDSAPEGSRKLQLLQQLAENIIALRSGGE